MSRRLAPAAVLAACVAPVGWASTLPGPVLEISKPVYARGESFGFEALLQLLFQDGTPDASAGPIRLPVEAVFRLEP